MAHGFRHVPQQRTASPPDTGRCPVCRALLRGTTLNVNEASAGRRPHICKETTYGTAVTPSQPIPFGIFERSDGPQL